jgi:hypothetical protein
MSKEIINKNDFNNRGSNRIVQDHTDNSKWTFEVKAKQALYEYKVNDEPKEK